MSDGVKFPHHSRTESERPTDLMPYLPFQLQRKEKSQDVFGLVDSGASVNVLPYQSGLNLGAIREDQ